MNSLERRAEHALAERIFFEAISLAYDIYGRYAVVLPPKRPTYVDFEAARMVGFTICVDRTTRELVYQPMLW